MAKPRAPRRIQISRDPNTLASDECPADCKPNPGKYPLFLPGGLEYRWIKLRHEPKYVRVYKILFGQPVWADWFQGDPETLNEDFLRESWGRGKYKVELMSGSTAESPHIERIFQRTLTIEDGEEDLPFPGERLSPKELADDGSFRAEDEDTPPASSAAQGPLGSPARTLGGRSAPQAVTPWDQMMQQQMMMQQMMQNQLMQMQMQAKMNELASPRKTDLAPIVTALVPIGTAIIGLIGTLASAKQPASDPALLATLETFKSELKAMKAQASGSDLQQVEKTLDLVDKISARFGSGGDRGGTDWGPVIAPGLEFLKAWLVSKGVALPPGAPAPQIPA